MYRGNRRNKSSQQRGRHRVHTLLSSPVDSDIPSSGSGSSSDSGSGSGSGLDSNSESSSSGSDVEPSDVEPLNSDYPESDHSNSDSVHSNSIPTESEILSFGLSVFPGFNEKKQQRVRHSLNVERFKSHYGVGPTAFHAL